MLISGSIFQLKIFRPQTTYSFGTDVMMMYSAAQLYARLAFNFINVSVKVAYAFVRLKKIAGFLS